MELPELEILRRDLEREAGGKRVKALDITSPGILENVGAAELPEEVVGAKIGGADRLGPWITLRLDTGKVLAFLLTERCRFRKPGAKPKPSKGRKVAAESQPDPTEEAALTIHLTQGGPICLIDPATTCRVFHGTKDELAALVGPVGMDIVAEPVPWVRFAESVLRRRGEKLKATLMDPTFMVGVGTMYSDEILFAAGLRYDRDPGKLTTQEVRRLHRAVVEVLHDAIKYGGTTLAEDGFCDLHGKPGGYAEYLTVFRRDGEMSPRARGPVHKVRFQGGYTWFCETQV